MKKAFLSIIVFLSCSSVLGQNQPQWIENDFSKHFQKYFLFNFEYKNGMWWVLSDDGLTKYDGNAAITYFLRDNSSGKLENYLWNLDIMASGLNRMFVRQDTIWLISVNEQKVLRILGDNVISYNLNLDEESFRGISRVGFDNDNNIWLIGSFYEKSLRKMLYKMLYGTVNNLKEFKYPQLNTFVNYFFIDGLDKYLIFDDSLVIIGENSRNIIYLNHKSPSLKTWNHFIKDDMIYLINTNWELYFIKDGEIIRSETLDIKNQNTFNTGIAVYKDLIYLSCASGIIVYDLTKKDYYITKPDDFESHCTWGFDDLKIIGNKLYARYGNALNSLDDSCKYGVGILNLENK